MTGAGHLSIPVSGIKNNHQNTEHQHAIFSPLRGGDGSRRRTGRDLLPFRRLMVRG